MIYYELSISKILYVKNAVIYLVVKTSKIFTKSKIG